jgi:hypothetical protein
MAVNLHWVPPLSGLLVERCLAVRAFPVPHTAAATAVCVKGVLGDFAVPEERCFFAVTDSASVMEAAVRDHMTVGRTRRFRCMAHWVQLIVLDALKATGAIDAVKTVRLYIKKVLRRGKWWEELAKHQKAEYPDRVPLKLFLDGGIRWSALFLMCERAAKVEKAILKHLHAMRAAEEEQEGQEVLADYEMEDEEQEGVALPTGAQLKVLRQLVPLLRPLYDATNVFQADGDKSSISVVVPEVMKLYARLVPGPLEVKPARYTQRDGKTVKLKDAEVIEADMLSISVQDLRAALLVAVQQRFGPGSAPYLAGDLSFYYAATFLDHRKRDLPSIQHAHPKGCPATRGFMTAQAAGWFFWEEEMVRLREEKEEEERRRRRGEGAGAGAGGGGGGAGVEEKDDDENVAGELTAEQLEYLRHAAIKAASDGVALVEGDVGGGSVPAPRRLTEAEHKNHAELEMDRWIKHPIPFKELSGAPLAWWARSDIRQKFPYLSNLARRLLAIPASSAKAERVFSQSGLVLNDLRTRMGMSTLEDLLVIKYQHCDGHVYKTSREWAKIENREDEEEAAGGGEGGGGGN